MRNHTPQTEDQTPPTLPVTALARSEAGRAETDLETFRRGLDRATDSDHSDFDETIEWTWVVGASGDDWAVWQHDTTVRNGEVLFWRRVWSNSNATPAPTEDEARARAYSNSDDLEILRVVDLPTRLSYVVFFDPPLKPSHSGPYRWTFEHHWPGFWDPLRSAGEDSCGLKLLRPADHATLRMAFPKGWDTPKKFWRLKPGRTGTQRFEPNGPFGPAIVWEIPNPTPGVYRAHVKARPPPT